MATNCACSSNENNVENLEIFLQIATKSFEIFRHFFFFSKISYKGWSHFVKEYFYVEDAISFLHAPIGSTN